MGLRAYGWRSGSESLTATVVTLDYTKEKVDCRVTITRESGGTYVRIDLSGSA